MVDHDRHLTQDGSSECGLNCIFVPGVSIHWVFNQVVHDSVNSAPDLVNPIFDPLASQNSVESVGGL